MFNYPIHILSQKISNETGIFRETQDEYQPSTSAGSTITNCADVKPNLRQAQQENAAQQRANNLILGIKEEISWYTHKYEKENRFEDGGPSNASEIIDLCDDSDDDLIIIEQARKRRRTSDDAPYLSEHVATNGSTSNIENNATISDGGHASANSHSSRGAQLSTDLLNTKSKPVINKQQIPATSVDIVEEVIAKITKWEHTWILEHELNPLEFRVNSTELPAKFDDFPTYRMYVQK